MVECFLRHHRQVHNYPRLRKCLVISLRLSTFYKEQMLSTFMSFRCWRVSATNLIVTEKANAKREIEEFFTPPNNITCMPYIYWRATTDVKHRLVLSIYKIVKAHIWLWLAPFSQRQIECQQIRQCVIFCQTKEWEIAAQIGDNATALPLSITVPAPQSTGSEHAMADKIKSLIIQL